MLRIAAPLVLLLALVGCGEPPAPQGAPGPLATEFGENPARLNLGTAEATVQPPAGRWLSLESSPAPAQWHERLTHPENGVVLQASVFPVQGSREAPRELARAIDTFVRALGTDGFGQSQREVGLVLGAPVASAAFVAMVNHAQVNGRARLILIDAETWALAIGVAPAVAEPAVQALVATYVASLEPTQATFYDPTFAVEEELAAAVVAVPGEQPVTARDIAAVQLAIEVGTGVRFPVRAQPALRAALAEEARLGQPLARAAFREIGATIASTTEMPAESREAGLRTLGQRILQQILERSAAGYAPAANYQAAWSALGRALVGTEEAGVSAASIHTLHEMSAFLASIASNGVVAVRDDGIEAVRERVEAGWAAGDADEREAFVQSGRQWAALRYAWDHAEPAAKFAFRQAVVAALAAEGDRATVEALADDRALLGWMDAHAAEGPEHLRRALDLGRTTRQALLARLGVEAAGYHVGW
ncbi:MAG: hypothetical protein O2894_03625 [Planctomycetota bacterium]|nr:hypothetical protein [Planctomycetota bacterium]